MNTTENNQTKDRPEPPESRGGDGLGASPVRDILDGETWTLDLAVEEISKLRSERAALDFKTACLLDRIKGLEHVIKQNSLDAGIQNAEVRNRQP